jgi:hypothetical protein
MDLMSASRTQRLSLTLAALVCLVAASIYALPPLAIILENCMISG